MKELEEGDDEYCPNSKDHRHEPDWNTVTTDYHNGIFYIDVNCKHCGQNGCIGTSETLKDEVRW